LAPYDTVKVPSLWSTTVPSKTASAVLPVAPLATAAISQPPPAPAKLTAVCKFPNLPFPAVKSAKPSLHSTVNCCATPATAVVTLSPTAEELPATGTFGS
jgi:hypothetical protein